MSLKAFHLVFVSCMTLLTFGCGFWLLRQYLQAPEGNRGMLIVACVALITGMGVLWYGKYFLKKLKNYSYL